MNLSGNEETTETRRDAVRAAYDRLREQGTAERQTLADAAWAADSETYDTKRSLWQNTVAPALASLPEVETVEGSPRWRYHDDRE